MEVSRPKRRENEQKKNKKKPRTGCIIGKNNEIAVDYWSAKSRPSLLLFFLSHAHEDHMNGLTEGFRNPIYCSTVTAELLPVLRPGIDRKLIRPLEINERHLIEIPGRNKEVFSVTVLDANHCPGAVMYFFEGYFGNILCTGDFRYDSTMQQWCQEIDVFRRLYELPIDELYLDNTYYNSTKPDFPTRQESIERVIDLMDSAEPETETFIAIRKLGKEELLTEIAHRLDTVICVSKSRFQTLQALQTEDVFTTNPEETRVHAVILDQWWGRVRNARHAKTKVLAIFPSAVPLIAQYWKDFIQNASAVDWVLYSDHSSRVELELFLSHMQIRKIVPISQVMERSEIFLYLDLPNDFDLEQNENEHDETASESCLLVNKRNLVKKKKNFPKTKSEKDKKTYKSEMVVAQKRRRLREQSMFESPESKKPVLSQASPEVTILEPSIPNCVKEEPESSFESSHSRIARPSKFTLSDNVLKFMSYFCDASKEIGKNQKV